MVAATLEGVAVCTDGVAPVGVTEVTSSEGISLVASSTDQVVGTSEDDLLETFVDCFS